MLRLSEPPKPFTSMIEPGVDDRQRRVPWCVRVGAAYNAGLRRLAVTLIVGLAFVGCQSSRAPDAGPDAGDAGPDGGDAGPNACADGGMGQYCAAFNACICGPTTCGIGFECGWIGQAVCPLSYSPLGCFDLGCADLNWDALHCGSCETVCDATEVCGAGTCILPDASVSCPNVNVGGIFTATLSGPFPSAYISFAGTFSDLISDGGVDLSSLNVVLSDQDLSSFCATPVDGGYQRPVGPYQVLFLALHSDGGTIDPGCFSSGPADGTGPQVDLFTVLPDASVVLTWRSENGANGGALAAIVQDGGASGVFRTVLTDGDGGMSPLSGSFNAQSCQGLAFVH
jgi:hypothetical protein